MTTEEFDNFKFIHGLKAEYKGRVYNVISVDFEEKLIAIDEFGDGTYESWKRCENIKIINL